MDKLVLILDDDLVYLNFMRSHFRQMGGYVVEAFSDGDELIKAMGTKNPFMAILDHNLSDPTKNGVHYLKQIKKLRPTLPVIYITSEASDSLKREVLKLGVTVRIIKSESFLVHLRTAIDEIITPKKPGLLARLFK